MFRQASIVGRSSQVCAQQSRIAADNPRSSFVRSVSMDKWKDTELEKMKVGGNSAARAFFGDHPDFVQQGDFRAKWNSKAAALYRDKVLSRCT
jgi:hypothetical protein